MEFPTRFDTNLAVQPQKIILGLVRRVVELHIVKTKPLFSHMQNSGFLIIQADKARSASDSESSSDSGDIDCEDQVKREIQDKLKEN